VDQGSEPRQRAPRLSNADRRRGIVDAVLALARERGPDAITTHAIAERIGVTQGAVFRHFPDKASIWLAVFEWVRKSLDASLRSAIDADVSPLAKIERAFLAHVAFVAAHPGVPRMLYHELQFAGESAVRKAVRASVGDYRRRLARLFDQAKREGELPATLDSTLATVLFIGAVQGLVIQAALTGNDALVVKGARPMLALLLDGYRAGGR
jgi:TetR/AcrR family transcriptional regulator